MPTQQQQIHLQDIIDEEKDEILLIDFGDAMENKDLLKGNGKISLISAKNEVEDQNDGVMFEKGNWVREICVFSPYQGVCINCMV